MEPQIEQQFRDPNTFDLMIGVATRDGRCSSKWHKSNKELRIPPGWIVAEAAESGQPVDNSRNIMCAKALQGRAKYLLFWDSDVLAAPDALEQLLSLRLPVVGGLLRSRGPPHQFLANLNDSPLPDHIINQPPGLIEVDELAMGFVVIDTRALKRYASKIDTWQCFKNHKLDAGHEVVVFNNENAVKQNYQCSYCKGLLHCKFFDYRAGKTQKLAISEDYFFCVPPDQIVYTTKSPMKIVDINPNDRVIAPKKVETRVVRTYERMYDGNLVVIQPLHGMPIKLTEEHPVLVSRRTLNGRFVRVRSNLPHNLGVYVDLPMGCTKNEWIPAKDLRVTDKVFFQKTKLVGGPVKYIRSSEYNTKSNRVNANHLSDLIEIDEKLMLLIGLYAAEGHICRQPTLTMHKNEKWILDEMRTILSDKLGMRSRYKDGLGVYHLVVDSGSLGNFLTDMVGAGAENKHLPSFWNMLSNVNLSALIRGVFTGDGCISPKSAPGHVDMGVCSGTLARQISLALSRFGIFAPVRFQSNEHRGYFVVTIMRPYQKIFLEKIMLMKDTLGIPQKGKERETKNGFWIRLKSIKTEKYSGPVYNLETEYPNAFNVEGIGVHNCRNLKEKTGLKVFCFTGTRLIHENSFGEISCESASIGTSLSSAANVT